MLYNKMNLVQACLNMSELVLGIFSSPVIKLFQQIGCEICILLLTLWGFDHLYHYPFFVLDEKKPSRALISPTQNGGSNPLSYFSFRLRVVVEEGSSCKLPSLLLQACLPLLRRRSKLHSLSASAPTNVCSRFLVFVHFLFRFSEK